MNPPRETGEVFFGLNIWKGVVEQGKFYQNGLSELVQEKLNVGTDKMNLREKIGSLVLKINPILFYGINFLLAGILILSIVVFPENETLKLLVSLSGIVFIWLMFGWSFLVLLYLSYRVITFNKIITFGGSIFFGGIVLPMVPFILPQKEILENGANYLTVTIISFCTFMLLLSAICIYLQVAKKLVELELRLGQKIGGVKATFWEFFAVHSVFPILYNRVKFVIENIEKEGVAKKI